MPYNLKNKLFFIHIPKTAGSSIETVLGMKEDSCFYSTDRFKDVFKTSPQHLTYTQIASIFNTRMFDFFTVVRNPYDRLVSEYKYILSGKNIYWEPYKIQDFDLFVETVFNLPASCIFDLFDNHFASQSSYLTEAEANIKIFKYENLEKLRLWLSSKTGSDVKLPHEKNSKKMHYSFYYKYKRTIDMVSELYSEDLKNFNYSFENTDI
jgi:hypothetical protein